MIISDETTDEILDVIKNNSLEEINVDPFDFSLLEADHYALPNAETLLDIDEYLQHDYVIVSGKDNVGEEYCKAEKVETLEEESEFVVVESVGMSGGSSDQVDVEEGVCDDEDQIVKVESGLLFLRPDGFVEEQSRVLDRELNGFKDIEDDFDFDDDDDEEEEDFDDNDDDDDEENEEVVDSDKAVEGASNKRKEGEVFISKSEAIIVGNNEIKVIYGNAEENDDGSESESELESVSGSSGSDNDDDKDDDDDDSDDDYDDDDDEEEETKTRVGNISGSKSEEIIVVSDDGENGTIGITEKGLIESEDEITVSHDNVEKNADEIESENGSESESNSESVSGSSGNTDDAYEEEDEEEDFDVAGKGETKIREAKILGSKSQEIVIVSDDEEEDADRIADKGPIESKDETQVISPVVLQSHHTLLPVGFVLSIVGTQIIVEGVGRHSSLDVGSTLWITERRIPLGLVNETFGPVKIPYYVVRFKSQAEVPDGIRQGTLVSFLPDFEIKKGADQIQTQDFSAEAVSDMPRADPVQGISHESSSNILSPSPAGHSPIYHASGNSANNYNVWLYEFPCPQYPNVGSWSGAQMQNMPWLPVANPQQVYTGYRHLPGMYTYQEQIAYGAATNMNTNRIPYFGFHYP